MLRRVARVLRWLLLVTGVCSLAWLPASFFYNAGFVTPLGMSLSSGSGGVTIHLFYDRGDVSWSLDGYFEREPHGVIHLGALLPEAWYSKSGGIEAVAVALPIWLFAAICLAWPVTSFIIDRRRHKRGFPVEPKGGGEAVSPPASSS